MVLVDHAAEYLPAPHWRTKRHDDRLVMIGWPLLPGLMRSVIVVMPGVGAQYYAEMTFTIDQHPVRALNPYRPYPAFGILVRPGRLRSNLHDPDALTSEDIIEHAAELGVAIRMRNRKKPIRPARSITRLRACWAVHAPSG